MINAAIQHGRQHPLPQQLALHGDHPARLHRPDGEWSRRPFYRLRLRERQFLLRLDRERGRHGAMDDITKVFSHEYAEAVTDPAGTAWQVTRGTAAQGNWNEICDGEAQRYTFRVNNYLVQSYFGGGRCLRRRQWQYPQLLRHPGRHQRRRRADPPGGVRHSPGRQRRLCRGRWFHGPVRPGQDYRDHRQQRLRWGIIFIDQTGPDAPVTVNLNDGAFNAEQSTSAVLPTTWGLFKARHRAEAARRAIRSTCTMRMALPTWATPLRAPP